MEPSLCYGDGMSDEAILAALARLEVGQTGVTTRLAGLEAGQTEMRAEITGLRAELAAFRAGMVAELGKTRGEIMEKVEGVQNSLTAIRDDIAVNIGSVDAARKANDNTRSDVTQMREQMSVMWRQIKQLESRVRDITGDP
jgi:uncharacterized coiled-coil DUF342 family protein